MDFFSFWFGQERLNTSVLFVGACLSEFLVFIAQKLLVHAVFENTWITLFFCFKRSHPVFPFCGVQKCETVKFSFGTPLFQLFSAPAAFFFFLEETNLCQRPVLELDGMPSWRYSCSHHNCTHAPQNNQHWSKHLVVNLESANPVGSRYSVESKNVPCFNWLKKLKLILKKKQIIFICEKICLVSAKPRRRGRVRNHSLVLFAAGHNIHNCPSLFSNFLYGWQFSEDICGCQKSVWWSILWSFCVL